MKKLQISHAMEDELDWWFQDRPHVSAVRGKRITTFVVDDETAHDLLNYVIAYAEGLRMGDMSDEPIILARRARIFYAAEKSLKAQLAVRQ